MLYLMVMHSLSEFKHEKKMNNILKALLLGLSLIACLPTLTMADEDFLAEQRNDFDTLSQEDIINTRKHILSMSEETLKELYKQYPELQKEVESAYGYGVFEGQAVNLIMYVAGNGLGVVYDNKTSTPVFMNAVRAGTGPGIGYKSMHGIIIFDNETVFDQFTNIGLQLSASGDATVKLAGTGATANKAVSLVPGVTIYQLVDNGLVLQANWGATEFLKDPNLNNINIPSRGKDKNRSQEK